jgi:hypothetical protein
LLALALVESDASADLLEVALVDREASDDLLEVALVDSDADLLEVASSEESLVVL